MHVRRQTFAALALGALTIAGFWATRPDARALRPLTVREALGDRDDPLARVRWEHERLRDPATGRIPADMRVRELAFASALPERPAYRADDGSGGAAWTFRGPGNVGGRTRALAFDVSDPTGRTLLAGGISGGMWRTTDDGASWTLTTGSDDFIGVSAVAQDTRAGRQSTWYYGTGEFVGSSASEAGAIYRGHGIFKSLDGGRTWAQLPSTAQGTQTEFDSPFDYVYRVVTDPSNPQADELYAACIGGIQRSTDGGSSWTSVLGSTQPNETAYFTDVVILPNGVLYAALDSASGQRGIWRSNSGTSWTKISPANFPATYDRVVLGVSPANPNQVWVAASGTLTATNHSLYRYTYISGDGSGVGGEWLDRSTHLANLPLGPHNDNLAFNSQGGYDLVVAVKPDDPDFVVLGGVDLIRSTDGFATAPNRAWIGGWLFPDPQQDETHHSDQHVVLFHPNDPNVIYTGSDGGVHKAPDVRAPVVQWQSLNNGYHTSQFYTLALDHAVSSNVLIGGLQDNGTWWTNGADSGVPWVSQFGGDGAFCAVADNASAAGGFYYLSAQNNVTYRWGIAPDGTFQENTWTRVDPLGINEGNVLFINPFILDPADTRRMYMATRGGVWRNSNLEQIPAQSNDRATTNWVQLTTLGSVSALAASENPAGVLYYGTADGRVYKVPNAPTAPQNTTPQEVTEAGIFPAGGYMTSLAIDPRDADKVLAGFSNYQVVSLFYTQDGGANWTAVEGNLSGVDGPSVRSVGILDTDEGSLFFAGTSSGLYSTTSLSGGATVWSREAPTEIGTLLVDHLEIRSSDRLVVAGTHGAGVFSARFTGAAACATVTGDATGDGVVDVTDVTRLVNHILGSNPLDESAQLCANVRTDSSLDVFDVVKIIRLILGLPLAGREALAGDDAELPWSLSSAADRSTVVLGPGDVAAVQLTFELPSGATVEGSPRIVRAGRALDLDWALEGSRLTILAFASDLASESDAAATEVEIRLRGATALEVTSVLASDSYGRPWPLADRSAPDLAPRRSARIVSISPNPSPDAAVIEFDVASSGPARLEIYDLNGRRLRTLVDGWHVAGVDRVRWDGLDAEGRGVASGTYFARLSSPLGEARASVLILR